ncbi:MAG: hypothetical protein KAV87_58225, partial [Desulfobacteraceae bacterium]|nr:hypothetical protein [Desulfobacteraceae bacterium]
MKTKNTFRHMSCFLFLLLVPVLHQAYAAYGDHDGPYGENDGIHATDSSIEAWAKGVQSYSRPEEVNFGEPENVLGQPGGTFDAFSLGDGGWIVVTFDQAIANGPGSDFAVWENGFVSVQGGDAGLLFAELMFVEVSSDAVNFARFPSVCLNGNSVGGYGC